MKKKSASQSAFFNTRALTGFALCLLGTVLALFAFTAGGAAAGSPQTFNQQLIFQDRSGTGSGSFAGKTTHFGYWIWCQAVSANAYGTDCRGAMYFYDLGIDTGVDGNVTYFNESNGTLTFTVSVSSVPNTKISNCVFSFSGPVSSGATNTVSLTCDTPKGAGADTTVAIHLAP